MRTETTTRTLYQFSELSETAKQTAISNLYDVNVFHDWWDCTYSDAREIGLKITEFDLYRNRHCTGNFLESAEECAHKIQDTHGETCETYKTATDYLHTRNELTSTWPCDDNGDYDDPYELDAKLDEMDSEFLKSLLEDYSIILQNEYEYLTSEESIIETIECNEYEFTETGILA